ncbi:hypothetical protein [uncultured Psychrobacillus sp.]|uniref:hypothetical protein n=1 Tax=uncultured Psychrobacillus sp. TaxID=1551585 RepID=UPI002613F0CB|nr:hypothetical protein [uncultured Psychrobacillus sp.]
MSGPSFSSIQLNAPNVISSKVSVPMKEGQVIHGTIKNLFPNQTAEVQIGNQKIIAKLETPLKTGDAHFFQVTKAAPEIQLKVVTGPLSGGNSLAHQSQQLLQAMNLSKSSEMQAIIQFFIKEQLPISKEILIQAEQLIKNLPPNATLKGGLEAIQKMIELKIPMTSKMFDTLLSGKTTTGFPSLITNLKTALQQEQQLSPSQKEAIVQNLQKIGEPFHLPVAGALLGKQLQTLLNTQLPSAVRLPILQQLINASILPSEATLNNPVPISNNPALKQTAGEIIIISKLMQPNIENKLVVEQLRSWIQNQPLLSSSQKEQVLMNIKEGEAKPNLVTHSLVKVFSEQSQQAVFKIDSNGLTPKDHLVSLLGKGMTINSINQTLEQLTNLNKDSPLIQFRNQAEQTVLSQLDGKAFEMAMKETLKMLGYSYEGKLASGKDEVRQLASQLKPQLVELLQMPNISATVRDGAESIISRMNGLQLLSGENGPQHQLLMQVPLEFLGKRMDATLEWNGRMKEDGKIDSDFARIMFYLQLDSLKETVVDMQVQNKIVTINLFNDDQTIETIANKLKPTLKEGLATAGYQLSGIFIKTFAQQKMSSLWPNNSSSSKEQGVDIRI